LAGLVLSYALNLTSGATIILVAAAGFFAAVLWERLKPRCHEDPSGGTEKQK
jgi:ABC-type Mn2+/Zn2+ transport system permease subunit